MSLEGNRVVEGHRLNCKLQKVRSWKSAEGRYPESAGSRGGQCFENEVGTVCRVEFSYRR